MKEDLIYRLRKRAEIRRQITTRKSVQEGQPDRIADLLEEAATALENLQALVDPCDECQGKGYYLIDGERRDCVCGEGDDEKFNAWYQSFAEAEWEDVSVEQAFKAGCAAGRRLR